VRIGAYLDTNQQVKSKDECAVYFFIEDTGIGISEEAQKELFTPFKQADDTINRKYGGTGLGLSICKRLIEAMGSEINVRSREGFGSTFYFTLLFNVHEEQDSVEASPESNNAYKEENKPASVDNEISQNQSRTYSSGKKGRDLRILVVDDNEVNRKVVKAFLDKEDHETVMIHSGKEALSLLQHDNRFHAILLDIEMPDMNGKDVARAILKDKLLNHIPIIALTGNISESDLELYERIGFAGCVAKPIVPEDMLDIINSASSDIYSKQAANKMDESEEIIINEESSVRHDSDAVDKITDEAIKQSPPIPQQDTNVGKTLDEKMVKGLRDGLGIQQSKELLAELFTKAEDIIDGIDRAIQEDKLNEIHMRAHELKGMAGNFGLKAISDKATQLENLCKDNKITAGECVTHKEDLKNLLERSEIAINNYFKDE
jgi:CheY-like chemotaxis protein